VNSSQLPLHTRGLASERCAKTIVDRGDPNGVTSSIAYTLSGESFLFSPELKWTAWCAAAAPHRDKKVPLGWGAPHFTQPGPPRWFEIMNQKKFAEVVASNPIGFQPWHLLCNPCLCSIN